MDVAESCTFEAHEYTDEVAGKTVRRITSTEYWSHHPYFYFNMWTEDSRRVLVSSNRDDGVWRLYLLDVTTGEAVCLTNEPDRRNNMAELSRDGGSVLYSASSSLKRLDLATFQAETIYTQDDPWTAWGVYFSAAADHTRAALVQMHKDDHVPAKTGWDNFRKQHAVRPRCRLVEVDLATGEANVLLEDRCWFGHPNYRPDGRTIMFCHEGPWNLVDSRIWFIDPDGSNLREGRERMPDNPPGEQAEAWGHEFWLADSTYAAYEYYPGKKDTVAGTSINLLDPDTLEERILMTSSRYSHFLANREATLIVGDGSPSAADSIFIIDVPSKTERALCRHGSSMKPYIDPRSGRPNTQMVHPHPAFSPDSSKVVYSSDLHGSPAVYVVEV